MTNEQIEQAVRKVVGQDANPRKIQALMWAVERYGLEWLKTYQQRQQSEASKARQYTSRQRSTLDWADVEAWVKRQPQTSENWVVGGYYTACPVPTHKTDDLISVWAGKDGGLGLKCWGNCTYSAIHESLADAIKIGSPPDTDPAAVPEARIKELEATLAATKDHHAQEQADFEEHLADIKARHAQELESRSSAFRGATLQARRKGREEEHARNEGHIRKLEKELTVTKAERERERAARIAAETKAQEPQAGNSSLEKNLAATKAERERERIARIAAEEERDRERTSRATAENRVRELEEELSHREETRTTTKAEREQGGNGRLSSAWRLFSKEEPTYAFVEATRVLENVLRNDLHRHLRHEPVQQPTLQTMLIDVRDLHIIDQEQWNQLDDMRRYRNFILHESRQLTEPQARRNLAYLEQVIEQL